MFDLTALKVLLITAIAGLATTIGSLLGLAVKKESPKFMCSGLGFTAGIMTFISIDELVPVSASYGYSHLPILSFLAGIIVMFASLILLK